MSYGKAFFAKLFCASKKATVSRALQKRAHFLLLLSGTKEVSLNNAVKPVNFSQINQIPQKFPFILPGFAISGRDKLLKIRYTTARSKGKTTCSSCFSDFTKRSRYCKNQNETRQILATGSASLRKVKEYFT